MADLGSPEPEELNESRPEAYRFVRVPVESVQSCADQLGVKTTEDVPGGIVEDVSFRLRQITDTAAQFMHHSKRRKLTVEDMDKAMKFTGLENLYGYHCQTFDRYEDEEDSMLEDIALAPLAKDSLTSASIPSMSSSWLMVEGVEIGDEEGEKEVVQISPGNSESQHEFLSTILEAVTGEDEDHRRIVLVMVQNKLSVASVLPALVQYLQQTLSHWDQFTPLQLDRLLKLLLALFQNQGLFLDPYCSALFPSLKEIILSSSYLLTAQQTDDSNLLSHWDVRRMAALSLAQLLTRCSSMLTKCLQELSSDFQAVLTPPHSSTMPVLYGVILTLVFHSPVTVVNVFCPHMQSLVHYLSSLADSGGVNGKRDVSKVMDAVLLTAELLLTCNTSVPLPFQSKPVLAESGVGNSSGGGGGSVTKTSSIGRDLLSPGSDVMDHSSRLMPSSTSGPSSSSLFGSPSLSLNPGSVLEGDLHDTSNGLKNDSKPRESSMSLYGFFSDIFGEGLVVRLASHGRYKALGSSQPLPKETKSIGSEKQREELVVQAMDRLLEREGFKSARVQLPSRHLPLAVSSHRRSAPGPRVPWTFPLPQAVLPVSKNPLDMDWKYQNGEMNKIWNKKIIKGSLVKDRSRNRKCSSIDIGEAWL